MNSVTTNTPASLRERWNQLLEKEPNLRIRNAANELGVSEVELLATRVGEGVTRLRPEFKEILAEVPNLGRVMALTRNDDVVHERKGEYVNPKLNDGHVGLFLGADIDLRIFFNAWGSAFAVRESSPRGDRDSLQFFGKDGEAIHKIYLIENSDRKAYEKLIEEFRSDNQEPAEEVKPFPPGEKGQTLDEAGQRAFQEAWLNLKDTHDFFGLLKKYNLDRTQALRYAPEGGYAVPVDNGVTRKMLEQASSGQVPIMVFVGNRGMIQIHSGPVEKVLEARGWFNVLDPDFNLHLRDTAFAESWIVRKPTDDGMVNAIEVYDADGKQVVQFFGKRKPGIPELESWRELVTELEAECKDPAQ